MSQLRRIPIRQVLYSTIPMDDIEFEVSYTYTPATPDVWYLPNGDPGYPGDPAEADIQSIKLWGVDMLEAMPEKIFQQIYDRVLEEAAEYEPDEGI